MKRFFRLFFRLLTDSLIRAPHPLTPRRIFVLLLFFSSIATLRVVHGFCFVLDDLFFPDYKKVSITKPLFIAGVPRSGTTFLHQLLAADSERFHRFLIP